MSISFWKRIQLS